MTLVYFLCVLEVVRPSLPSLFLLRTITVSLSSQGDPGHILENFHVVAAFRCMTKERNNILKNLSLEDQRAVRGRILRLVMATSLADQFTFVSTLKREVVEPFQRDLQAAKTDPAIKANLPPAGDLGAIMARYMSPPAQASLVMQQMLMKAADISNTTKKTPLYLSWMRRIMEEFYQVRRGLLAV